MMLLTDDELTKAVGYISLSPNFRDRLRAVAKAQAALTASDYKTSIAQIFQEIELRFYGRPIVYSMAEWNDLKTKYVVPPATT